MYYLCMIHTIVRKIRQIIIKIIVLFNTLDNNHKKVKL